MCHQAGAPWGHALLSPAPGTTLSTSRCSTVLAREDSPPAWSSRTCTISQVLVHF